MRHPLQLQCMLLLAVTVFASQRSWAQDVSGAVSGRVTNRAGEPVTDTRITVTGEHLQATRTSLTDVRGHFQIAGLPAGLYQVHFATIGYRPVVREDVRVHLGRTTSVGLIELSEGAIELAPLVVTGETPLLDVTSASSGFNLQSDDFETLPVSRDIQSLTYLAPQANQSFFGDAVNISGSTGPETFYYVDGIDATEVMPGMPPLNLPYNFVREIQITTGGYETEYGRSQGGIVNLVTHSGSNRWQGEVYGFLRADALTSTPRLGLSDPDLETSAAYDIGLGIGGPIVRDRLWFYGAYNPLIQSGKQRYPGIPYEDVKSTTHRFAGKLSWRVNDASNVGLTLIGSPATRNVLVPIFPFAGAPAAVQDPSTLRGSVTQGGLGLSARGTYLVRPTILLEATLAWFTSTNDNVPRDSSGWAPLAVDVTTGGWSGGYGGFSEASSSRLAAGASATFSPGAHEVKVGLEYEDNMMDQSFLVSDLFVDPSDPVFPYVWFQFPFDGRSHNRVLTLFLQDSWQITPRLRLNPGVRWDAQYMTDSLGAVAQSVTNQFQPRLGAIYQPGRLGSQKIFGSVGRYYLQLPLFLAITQYGGYGRQTVTGYPQDPRVDTTGGVVFSDATLGGAPRIDGLRGQNYDEVTLGYERRFEGTFKIGARLIHRILRWVIEDGCPDSAAPEGCAFVTGNPGGVALDDFPRAARKYTALELTLERFGSRRFNFLASYIFSRSWGNYTGLFATDVRIDGGNAGPQFDWVDQYVNGNATGMLPNDRTHVLKFFGTYKFDIGLSAGAFLTWQRGTPLSELGGIPAGPPYWSFLQTRGAVGRTPTLWDINLRFSYDLPTATSSFGAKLLLDILHIGSPRRAVDFDQVHYTGVDGDGNQAGENATYGSVLRYQPPMSVVLGLLLSF